MRQLKKILLSWAVVVLFCNLWLTTATANDNRQQRFTAGLAAFDGGDYQESFALWQPLAKAGVVPAQLGLALIYDQGLGLKQDVVKAVFWYRQAAAEEDPIAQIALAEKFEKGQGLAPDNALALAWYARAADNGSLYAAKERDRLMLLVPISARKTTQ
jgi:TPR repeat protein